MPSRTSPRERNATGGLRATWVSTRAGRSVWDERSGARRSRKAVASESILRLSATPSQAALEAPLGGPRDAAHHVARWQQRERTPLRGQQPSRVNRSLGRGRHEESVELELQLAEHRGTDV